MQIDGIGLFNYTVPCGHLSICLEGGIAFEADRRAASAREENPLPGRCHPRGLGPASSERRQRASAGHSEALSVHSAGGLWAQALDREKGKGQILFHFKRAARLMGCLPLAAGPSSPVAQLNIIPYHPTYHSMSRPSLLQISSR